MAIESNQLKATVLSNGSLQHNIKMLPDKPDIGVRQLQYRLNTHCL